MAQTLANPNAALPEQRERQLFFWIFIGNALGTGLVGFFDYQSQLTTFWDELGIPCLTLCYLVCGMIYYRRPEYLRWLITVCIVSSNIFQVGVMYYAIHYPSSVSYYSAASGVAYYPLVYVVLYITLKHWATRLSILNCSTFYLLFVVNRLFFPETVISTAGVQAEHLLSSVMFSHPVYILALRYIVQLRNRLNEAQEEVFRSKADFLGMLSHEIRNLLQGMAYAIDLLDLKIKDAAQRKVLTRLQTSAEQLNTYLSDVNELTKLENPSLALTTEQFSVRRLLEDICEEWQAKAVESGLELSIERDMTASDLWITSDKRRVRQVVTNLVSNALKYTAEGSVRLVASPSRDDFRGGVIEVSDTGIGIDPAQQARIFEPYVRLKPNGLRPVEGSGLGLSIVKKLVDTLNGKVEVSSGIGLGSVFYVFLPTVSIVRAG
jgi:signal transduction histidine kinase